MKKITMSLLTIAAMLVLVAGATAAYFTSYKSVAADTFTAGTLNIDATVGGSWNGPAVNISHLAPGDITDEATYTVKNVGNLDAATFARFTLANDNGLSNALKIYNYRVEYFKANGDPADRWATTDPYFGTAKNEDWFIKDGVLGPNLASYGMSQNLFSWVNGNGPLDIPGTAWDIEGMPAGAYYVVHVQFQMDPNAGNAYQASHVNIGYEAKATQLSDAAVVAEYGFAGLFPYMTTNADTYR